MGSCSGYGWFPADWGDIVLQGYPGSTMDESNFPRQDRGTDKPATGSDIPHIYVVLSPITTSPGVGTAVYSWVSMVEHENWAAL